MDISTSSIRKILLKYDFPDRTSAQIPKITQLDRKKRSWGGGGRGVRNCNQKLQIKKCKKNQKYWEIVVFAYETLLKLPTYKLQEGNDLVKEHLVERS